MQSGYVEILCIFIHVVVSVEKCNDFDLKVKVQEDQCFSNPFVCNGSFSLLTLFDFCLTLYIYAIKYAYMHKCQFCVNNHVHYQPPKLLLPQRFSPPYTINKCVNLQSTDMSTGEHELYIPCLLQLGHIECGIGVQRD